MAKVISNYRADLRLDLKDSGVVWSDAELDRCVERAVADLTRFRPLQKSIEFVVDSEVAAESFITPAASDADFFVVAQNLSGIADGATCTIAAGTPDIPRPVMLTLTDADDSITDLVVIVKGRDVDGNYVEEYFYLSGLIANSLVQTGKTYFAVVTEVEVHFILGDGAGDTLDVGTGSHLEVYVQLNNYPLRFQSDAVTGYARYTDYIMDYYSGRIALTTATTMAAATAYSISYTKSGIAGDLSNLTDLIRVESVEYPVGTVPQEITSTNVWGSIITLLSGSHSSQSEMTDDEHMLVHYSAQHQPPGASSPGTYPSFLDWTVELAASAYALFMEALQHEHQAATDLGEVRTTLGYLGIGHVGAGNPTFEYGLVDTALDKAAVLVTAGTGKIDLALAKVALYLETYDAGDSGVDNARDVLANITDNIAELRTAIGATAAGALGKGYTLLDKVATVDLDALTVGAVALLATGDDTINKLNDGESVPALYSEYAKTKSTAIAQARVQAALAYAQEASIRLANLRTYIEESGGWMRMGEVFIAEAQTLLGEVNAIVAEAGTRIALIDRFLAESAQYQETASNDMLLADRYRAEATERRNEAWAIWADSKQYAPNYAIMQRNQQA